MFVTALTDSNAADRAVPEPAGQPDQRVDDSRSDLDAALIGSVGGDRRGQRFVAGSREQTAEQIRSLAHVTQNLVDSRTAARERPARRAERVRQRLQHLQPATGGDTGAFALPNFSNPVHFVCGMIGARRRTPPRPRPRSCATQYLGPALRLLNFNNLPVPINPYLRPVGQARESDHLHRSEAGARRRGAQAIRPSRRLRCRPTPASGDVAAAARLRAPDRLRCRRGCTATVKFLPIPSPALFPGAPIPGRRNIQPGADVGCRPSTDMLLPAEPRPPPPPPGPLLPAEGTPPS